MNECLKCLILIYVLVMIFIAALSAFKIDSNNVGPSKIKLYNLSVCSGKKNKQAVDLTLKLIKRNNEIEEVRAKATFLVRTGPLNVRLIIYRIMHGKYQRALRAIWEACANISIYMVDAVRKKYPKDMDENCFVNPATTYEVINPSEFGKMLFPNNGFYGRYRADLLIDTEDYNVLCLKVEYDTVKL